jgi:hypothetical protein
MVASASIPFSILVLPQVLQNYLSISNGNAGALSIISWEVRRGPTSMRASTLHACTCSHLSLPSPALQGYLSGLLGNMLMCTHFAARGESSAVNVQLIGILNNMLVLSQVTLAGFMPPSVFAATTAMISLAVAINTGRLRGSISEASPVVGSIPVWSLWQLFAGVCGLALIPQVMSNQLLPGLNLGVVPGAACGLSLGAYFTYKMRSERSRSALRPVVGQLPGWAATLLFALSPLPQLVRNFMEPQSLEGLSLGTMLLALSGNALMLPRALFIRDPVWIAGTSWACLAGWGQLLSLRLGSMGAG